MNNFSELTTDTKQMQILSLLNLFAITSLWIIFTVSQIKAVAPKIFLLVYAEAYSEPCQASKIELLTKAVNS